MKKLNTMETFDNGFKIERDGKVIVLTKDEMFEFKWFYNALRGKYIIEDCMNSNGYTDEEKKILAKMMEDDEACYTVNGELMESLDEELDSVKDDIVDEYLEGMKEGD